MVQLSRSRGRRGGEAGLDTKASRKESSSQVARRQAARLLRPILKGDASGHATASVKSLIYHPSIKNKKATMALVCQTLKYLPIIQEVLESSDLLMKKNKMHKELLYVTTYELLFGKELVASGGLEDFVLARKNSLRGALARMLVKKNVACAEDLLPAANGSPRVRYVRVNTLKMGVKQAMEILSKSFKVEHDDVVPGLLALPAEADLHAHGLVSNGSIILQGKASCLPPIALAPKTDWVVLDACAAPGNKTVQLAALMNGKGKVLACEMNEKRIQRLYEMVELAGATNVEVMCQDFLKLDVNGPLLSQVKAILLDPSCSGSGTSNRRLDHLLPSFASMSVHKEESYGDVDLKRLERLACFQEKALRFALSFPAVERVVYSTCSIHQRENEDVVKAVLAYASSNGFRLGVPLPQWQHRGLPVFEGAASLMRVEPSQDMDGFFVALFERHTGDLVEMGPESGLSVAANFLRSSKSREKRKRKRKHKGNTLLASSNLIQLEQSRTESIAAMNSEQEDGARSCENGRACHRKRKRMC